MSIERHAAELEASQAIRDAFDYAPRNRFGFPIGPLQDYVEAAWQVVRDHASPPVTDEHGRVWRHWKGELWCDGNGSAVPRSFIREG